MKKVRIDFAPPSLRRTLFHTPRLAWLLLGAGLHAAPRPDPAGGAVPAG